MELPMQSIRIISRPPLRIMKWNQLNHFGKTSTKVVPIIKDLSWLQFDNEPRIQKRQQIKDQQNCMWIYVDYLTILSSY